MGSKCGQWFRFHLLSADFPHQLQANEDCKPAKGSLQPSAISAPIAGLHLIPHRHPLIFTDVKEDNWAKDLLEASVNLNYTPEGIN